MKESPEIDGYQMDGAALTYTPPPGVMCCANCHFGRRKPGPIIQGDDGGIAAVVFRPLNYQCRHELPPNWPDVLPSDWCRMFIRED